jgi:phage terminase small subunit
MLTPNQETFVQNIIQVMSQADAYRSAYSTKNMSDNAVYVNASKLMDNTKVALRLKELRDKLAKPSIMTAQERLEFLTQVINGTKCEKVFVEGAEVEVPASMKCRLTAVDIMNKMQGEYVTKIDGNLNVAKLEDLI